jgi:hypothetical protein
MMTLSVSVPPISAVTCTSTGGKNLQGQGVTVCAALCGPVPRGDGLLQVLFLASALHTQSEALIMHA